ncbi:MAG: class E sortase [Actinobacteria bacterium]|nr:class E sortase [Actinomycetota bacterium]
MKIGSKKLVWLLRILGIVLILAGVGVIFAPKIQNLFSIKDQENALVEWKISEEQYKEKLEEIKEEEKIELKEGKPPADFPLRMLIPAINLDTVVLDGTDRETLKKGPGHIIGTSYPGSIGTVAISGHRTTYGAPFFNVDKLKAGDEITLESFDTIYRYFVTELMIVKPTDVWVLNPTPYPSLVLTTCNPKYSAKERLIVFAKMIGEPEDK